MTKEELLPRLSALKEELKKQYPIDRLALFGSFARNTQTETSDVDLLVSFNRDISYFTFINLAEAIEQRLGRAVDLVPEDGMRPRFRQAIKEDLSYV